MSGRKLEIRRNLRTKKLKSRKVRSQRLQQSDPADGDTDTVQANIAERRKESSGVKAKPVVVVPQWNSDTINQKVRLTTSMRVGIFNHGCKSKFVSLQNIKPMSEEMLAREASDLQRILSLANPPMAPSHPSLSPHQEEEEDNTLILEDVRAEVDLVEKPLHLKLASSRAEVRYQRLSSISIDGNLGEGRITSNPFEEGDGTITVPVIDFQALAKQMDEALQSKCKYMSGFRRRRGNYLRNTFSQRSRDSSVGDSGIEVKETNSAQNSAGSAAQRSGCSQGSSSSSAVSYRTSQDARWSSLPVPGGRQFGAPASAVTLNVDQQTGSFLWMEAEEQQHDLPLRSPSLLASPNYQTAATVYTKQPQGNAYHHKTSNQLNKPFQEQGMTQRTSTMSFAPQNMPAQQIYQPYDNPHQSCRPFAQIPCRDPRAQSHMQVNYMNPHPGYPLSSCPTRNLDPNAIFRRRDYNVPTQNIPSNPPSVDYSKLCSNITSPPPNPFYESQYSYPDKSVLLNRSEYGRQASTIPSDHLDYRLKYYQEQALFTSKQTIPSRKNILTLTASDSDGSPAFRALQAVSPIRPPESPESHWQYHTQKMF